MFNVYYLQKVLSIIRLNIEMYNVQNGKTDIYIYIYALQYTVTFCVSLMFYCKNISIENKNKVYFCSIYECRLFPVYYH